jgi:hypothetical protein
MNLHCQLHSFLFPDLFWMLREVTRSFQWFLGLFASVISVTMWKNILLQLNHHPQIVRKNYSGRLNIVLALSAPSMLFKREICYYSTTTWCFCQLVIIPQSGISRVILPVNAQKKDFINSNDGLKA